MALNLKDPEVRARVLEHEVEVLRIKSEARRILKAEERGVAAFPEVQTLADFLAEPDDAEEYRVEGLQPMDSRALLAAQFKAGKTTIVANLIRSLLDGDPFLGKYAVMPVEGRVALIDFEMSKRQLKRWYRDQQIGKTARLVIFRMRGRAARFNLADSEVRRWWVEQLRAMGVTYLIVDCLRPILDALGLDEAHEVGAFFVPFDVLLDEAGISEALMVHHMGHANERSRGDSRLRDWPEVEWRLVRKDDDPASTRFFTAYGRDVSVEEQQLGYDALTRRLTVVGGSRRAVKVDDALPDVIAFIREQKDPPSGNAIVNGLGNDHAKNVVKAAIKAGIAQGRIVTMDGPRKSKLHSVVTDGKVRAEECQT